MLEGINVKIATHSNIDATTPMRFANTRLQKSVELHWPDKSFSAKTCSKTIQNRENFKREMKNAKNEKKSAKTPCCSGVPLELQLQIVKTQFSCETSLKSDKKYKKYKKWRLKMWKRNFCARLPLQATVENVKTKLSWLSCETIFKWKLKMWKRIALARLSPQKVKVEDVNKKLSCETMPSKSESGKCESIPLTISTTKRVKTCFVPSSDSWRIQAKKMESCTSFCSKRARAAFCSGVSFGTWKSEMHFVGIYFGMHWVIQETLQPSSASHAPSH